MKRIIVGISMALFLVSSAFGQVNWKMDPAHSEIQFKVKHLVITTVTGEFKDYDISFTSRKVDNFDNADLRVAIRTGSIFTDNEKRDEHLRSDDFLNAEAYPEIRFVAASFKKTGPTTYAIKGNLTIRDVTKPVELTAEYAGSATMRGNTLVAFHVTGEINRFDFGVKFNMALETGGLVVSEIVKFDINVEFAAMSTE